VSDLVGGGDSADGDEARSGVKSGGKGRQVA